MKNQLLFIVLIAFVVGLLAAVTIEFRVQQRDIECAQKGGVLLLSAEVGKRGRRAVCYDKESLKEL